MSSILKALKQLEEETVSGSGLKPRIRERGTGYGIGFFLTRRILPVVLAGMVGVGAAGYWIQRSARSMGDQTKPEPVVAEQVPMASLDFDPPAALKEKKTKPVENQQAPRPALPPRAKRFEPAAREIPQEKQEAPPRTPVAEQPAAPPGKVQEHTGFLKPAADIPVLEDRTLLRIQAISWTQTPVNRIAVVNNKVCREGDSIDGFLIRSINREDIHVDDGNKEWKVRF